MIVVEQLAAELKIKLAAELLDALSDMLTLELYILIIGKTDLKHRNGPPSTKRLYRKEVQSCVTKFEAGLIIEEIFLQEEHQHCFRRLLWRVCRHF